MVYAYGLLFVLIGNEVEILSESGLVVVSLGRTFYSGSHELLYCCESFLSETAAAAILIHLYKDLNSRLHIGNRKHAGVSIACSERLVRYGM